MEKLKQACLSRKVGKAEILALLLYILGVIAVSCFHEPWFDEAQAWQIARSASLYEILFEVPHYEGHPQLWHLILMPFAKLGFPFRATLSAVNLTFSAGAAALLVFRAPFPKIVRCLIPFTYFFFYQYGVVARPYSMMMLAIMLVCLTYTGRNQHPFRYLLPLCLLCMTGAYSLVTAGGLCVLWTIEIFMEYQKSRQWGKVLRDPRAYGLLGILALAVFILLSILPADDCIYAGMVYTPLERLKRLFYVILFPVDSLFGSYLNSYSEFSTTGGLIAECILGALVWFVLIAFLKTNKRLPLLIPYLLYCISCSVLQFSVHHLGLSTLYLVFLFWNICEDGKRPEIPTCFRKLYENVPSQGIRRLAGIMGTVIALLPILHTGVSSVLDIRNAYSESIIADYLKENGLDKRKIMLSWSWRSTAGGLVDGKFYLDHKIPLEHVPVDLFRTNIMGSAAVTLPYFADNIYMNFNADDPETLYMRWQDTADYAAVCDLWHEQGLPEVIVGYLPLDEIFSEEELEGVTYHWVETFDYGVIFKLTQAELQMKLYIREDVLEEYPQLETQMY